MRLTSDEIRRLSGRADLNLDSVSAIAPFLDSFGYLSDWRSDYRVKSAAKSLCSSSIMCIDAAILACALLDLFTDEPPRLLAIHRRSPDGEECGHVVALFRGVDGRLGAFAKSNYEGLGHRAPQFQSEAALAVSYAGGYRRLGFTPLYFGVASLDEICSTVDWRRTDQDLNFVSDEMCARYTHAFATNERSAHAQ